jgi:undecaprenyl-diphosphatase
VHPEEEERLLRRPLSSLPPRAGRGALRTIVTAPTITLICIGLLSALLFLLLGHAVRHQTTRGFDHSALRSIHLHTISFPVAIVTAISSLGSNVVITAIGVAWCIAFALRRRWLDALFVASAVGGYVILAVIAKNVLQQERPVDVFQIPDSQYRFPSGHTLGATCLAIALGYFLWRGRHDYGVKALGTIGLTGGVLGVGASRLVLNLHYPTDVAGGVLLGVAWMSMLIVARQILACWQRPHDRRRTFALSGIEEIRP